LSEVKPNEKKGFVSGLGLSTELILVCVGSYKLVYALLNPFLESTGTEQ
jgi:hypothetical protein